MAHFSSVNEGALISAINQCKANLSTAQTSGGNIESEAKSINSIGWETKQNIVNSASSIDASLQRLQSSLGGCLDLANKIKKYKAQKKLVDDLRERVADLEAQLAELESSMDAAYNEYVRLKSKPNRVSEAYEYYNIYININGRFQAKQEEYEETKKKYELEKKELEMEARVLSGMGFPPESN